MSLRRVGGRIAALLIAAGVLWYAMDSVAYMRLWTPVPAESPGACKLLPGLRGAEDVVVTQGGLVIASVNDRDEPETAASRNGALVVVALDGGAPQVLWDGRGKPFQPHGIDYWRDGRDEYLYAINHAPQGDQVMVFRLTGRSLELVREIAHPRRTLNDVAATGPTSFYVTVDHAVESSLATKLVDYLRLPAGHVEYFDGQTFRQVSDGIRFANGMVLSPDGRRVYVASMLGGRVLAYRRDPGGLVPVGEIDVPGNPDNLSWAPDGALLVAAHPKILDLARQKRERSFHAPSSVLRIEDPQGASPRVRVLLSDPGDRLSSASVAVLTPSALLVGSVFDDHMLACQMPAVAP